MKYRVKHHDSILGKFLFPLLFNTYSVQYKEHWWSKWKTCDNTDNIADAYNSLMMYQTNNKQSLPLGKYFTHNRDKNKQVWCYLELGHLKKHSKDFNNGEHYYAGYKPRNYHNFYYCCFGKSYEEALFKLYDNMKIKDLINKKSKKE